MYEQICIYGYLASLQYDTSAAGDPIALEGTRGSPYRTHPSLLVHTPALRRFRVAAPEIRQPG